MIKNQSNYDYEIETRYTTLRHSMLLQNTPQAKDLRQAGVLIYEIIVLFICKKLLLRFCERIKIHTKTHMSKVNNT